MRTYQVDISEDALAALNAICTAGLQVRQANVSREDILKGLSEIPQEMLLKVSQDIAEIRSGNKTIV